MTGVPVPPKDPEAAVIHHLSTFEVDEIEKRAAAAERARLVAWLREEAANSLADSDACDDLGVCYFLAEKIDSGVSL